MMPNHSQRSTLRRARTVGLVLGAIALTGACSGSDDASSATTEAPSATVAPTSTPSTSAPSSTSVGTAQPDRATPVDVVPAVASVSGLLESVGAEPDVAGCYQLVLERAGVEVPDDLIAMRDAFEGLGESSQLALTECLKHING